MKYRNEFIAISTFLITIVVLLTSSETGITGDFYQKSSQHPEVRIGHCPSMEGYASEIELEYEDKLVEYGSSSQVINALEKDLIDVAITGRPAGENEINKEDFQETYLRQGKTLITKERTTIKSPKLENKTIHTYLSENTVEEFLPDSEIKYHGGKREAKEMGIEEAVLVDWQDYEGEDLLIVKQGSRKDLRFRVPVMYTKDG